MEKITLTSLIEEQKARIPQLKYVPSPPRCIGFSYYCYEKSDEYQKWLATTNRYIGIHFPNDKDVTEFEKISKEKISPSQQQKLLAILEALASLPMVICDKNDTVKQGGDYSQYKHKQFKQSVAEPGTIFCYKYVPRSNKG